MNGKEIRACPVCGTRKIDEDGRCAECHWARDLVQEKSPDEDGGENFYSLNDCKILYKAFGTIWPTKEQLKDFDWDKA